MIAIPVIFAYLIGSVPFGLIVCRVYGIKDIRQQGSGNIGATNVWRIAGGKVAAWVFAGDILKGVLAVIFAELFYNIIGVQSIGLESFQVICGFVAILGHVFPVYLKFKGGKGVNTALGVVVSLMPLETLVAFLIFVVVLLISKYVSLGSMMAAVGFALFIFIEKFMLSKEIATVNLFLAIILALMILITHRHNMSRILNGTENRFSFSSRGRNKQ
ncbi:MAG: glycerol-3-phosphate 1-O-acyltransferase PlsY [candidate division Zixibacteria bacterium]|nr:glycerol-3-phosphate 1-O-acyltransferase PlsY [candidate division Zixibacteria bacterium]